MQAITFVIAFIVVLALIAGTAWLVRRFAGNRLGTTANRGRMPRLAVIDAAAVDGRRRLVLVRRDNVEHLLMIGGPSDIVVEPNIVRAPGRDQIPQRPSPGNEPSLPRLPPLAETGWTESDGPRSDSLDHPEEMPEPARPVLRPPFPDPARRPAAPERRNDPLAGFTPEPMSRTDIRGTRPARSEPTMPPRPPVRPAEPASTSPPRPVERPTFPPPPSPPTSPPPASNADQNLAEMAQRLEAALRRPANDGKPAAVAPPVVPEPPPRPRTVESSAAPASRSESPVAAAPVPTPGSKSGFEHLEDEMASLLGRPKSPS
jgi:hypothetical protein